jgi:hypothetical protein
MNAVAAADADGVAVLEGASLQHGEQAVEVGQQQVGGAHKLHVEAGIEHVGGGHALVHEAGGRADILGKVGQEGNHVMPGDALDLVDPLDLEGTFLPDLLSRLLRDHAQRRLGVAGMRLDLEPDAELALRRPDGGHLGPGVTGDHGSRFALLVTGRSGPLDRPWARRQQAR